MQVPGLNSIYLAYIFQACGRPKLGQIGVADFKGFIWGKCIKLLKITKGKLYAAGLWVSEDNPALLVHL